MPVRVYYSNHLEDLVRELRKTVSTPLSADEIFRKDSIITQTAGMSQWLSSEIARKENNGIFANFKLLNQDGFLHELYELITGVKAQTNQETCKWMIFELLGSEEFKQHEDFITVTEYYDGDDLKRIQLASRLADLFDQYQIYRENIIRNWNADTSSGNEIIAEKWQKWLWRKLIANGNFHPKEMIRDAILTAINDKDMASRIKSSYPVVNFFGNAIYTGYHLGIYEELASRANIVINHFVVLPVKERTEMGNYRNGLLQSFGKKYSELSDMLGDGQSVRIDDKQSSKTLLGTIQDNIYNNLPALPEVRVDDDLITDGTLQINSAYTESREVEILYNYLVDLINRNDGLKPQDILVLASDINLYAPYIKAVFSNAEYKIPYQISGASAGQRESIISAVIKILEFEEDDFTSENVIGLLESRSISKRYGIESTSDIRAIIKKANIRFGLEGRKEDDTRYVSWSYGLKKLVFGYGMLTEDSYQAAGEDESVYPFVDIEGKQGQEILRLKAFVEDLWRVIKMKNIKRTLSSWRRFIAEDLLDRMILGENEDKADIAFLFRQLNTQSEAENLMKEEIDFRVFYYGFKMAVSNEPGEFAFNSGKVTFSSLIPARGIPCKVIGFIGLNDELFPRRDIFVSYDLIPLETLPGDRSKKENDKLLFLDAILSAREYLYLSYKGRSSKDNSDLPPSIVLDELLDYLENLAQNPSVVRERLLVQHPLHGFSSLYQPDEKRLFSYLYGTITDGNEKKFLKQISNTENDIKSDITEIKLADLINFYKSPIKWFYQKSLGLSFEETEDHLDENERFDLNNLELWELKNDLLKIDIENKELIDRIRDKYVKNGDLPLKAFSEIEMTRILDKVEPVKDQKELLVSGRKSNNLGSILKVNDEISITGSVSEIYGNDLIAHSFSKDPLKYKIEVWIKYLFLQATGTELTVRFISHDGSAETFSQTVSRGEAVNNLEKLADYFKRGTSEMILFTPRSAEEYKTNKDVNAAYEVIESEATYDKYRNQSPDKYLQKAIADEQFQDLTLFDNYLEELTPILINF